MVKTKFLISTIIFVSLLIVTSVIKNKTRIIEKKISSLSLNLLSKKREINETQLDFFYLTSPYEIERRLSIIEFNNYQPISYSKIFFSVSDFYELKNKLSNFK